MKIFAKNSILQKIIIVILIVFCTNFIIPPTYSNADFGGVLASPIVDFFCSIGDVVTNLLQGLMSGEMKSQGAVNMSLSAFLMDSQEYYNSAYYTPATGTVAESNKIDPDGEFDKGWLNIKDEYYIPVATYSPEQIFSGNVSGLDINFINPDRDKWGTTKTGNGDTVVNSSSGILQNTIASWYVALRNLAVVGLLCVLVYVGIRIMLSSTASDKAKYKQMFMDWLIALCILFFMHYIMSFVLTLTESICTAIGGDGEHTISVYDESADKSFSTNLLGLARFKTQYADFGQKFTYFIFYMALVTYTAIFTWHYLKRLLMMAFLTIIAPMVSFTYPIDKIGDGKAQAFNMWLKEYIYNALIQPFHLIIYMVFVGSAMDLAETNMLYALAAMGFILFAEKILRKMFGFDRAPLGTMGALTGFTFGSLAASLGKGKGGGNKQGQDKGKVDSDDKAPRYEKKHGTDGIDYRDNNDIDDNDEESDNKNTDDQEGIVDRSRREFETENDENSQENNLSEDERQELDRLNNELDNTDYNDMYMNPDKYSAMQARVAELEEKKKGMKEEKPLEEDSKEDSENDAESESSIYRGKESQDQMLRGMRNVINAHGGGKHIALKGAKTLGRAAKFTARTAMGLGGAAAGIGIGLASGKGVAGVAAGIAAGRKIGTSMGDTLANIPGSLAGGATRIGKGLAETARTTIDTFNGNTELEDKARERAFMKDDATEQYIRDKYAKEHGGTAPTMEEIKEEKEKMKPYIKEGITDVAAIYRARKAEKYTTAEQSAKIAALAKDRNITSKELGDEKEYNRRVQDFTQEFMDKGMTEEQASRNADYVLNIMRAQVGQVHNLGRTPSSTRTNTSRNTQNRNSSNTRSNSNSARRNNGTNTRANNSRRNNN